MAGTAIDRLAARQARRHIGRFGRTFTYVHTAVNTFIDRTTLEAEEIPAPTEYAAKGVIRRVRKAWADGTLVHATDMEVLVARAALPVEPRQGARLKVGGRTLTVVDVRPMSSGQLDWGYSLIARA